MPGCAFVIRNSIRRSDIRSTQKNVAPFEFRAGLEIEMKFISNRRKISIRDQQQSCPPFRRLIRASVDLKCMQSQPQLICDCVPLGWAVAGALSPRFPKHVLGCAAFIWFHLLTPERPFACSPSLSSPLRAKHARGMTFVDAGPYCPLESCLAFVLLGRPLTIYCCVPASRLHVVHFVLLQLTVECRERGVGRAVNSSSHIEMSRGCVFGRVVLCWLGLCDSGIKEMFKHKSVPFSDLRHRPPRFLHVRATTPGVESGSPRGEASSLTTTPPRTLIIARALGPRWLTVSVLASHQGDPGSIPGWVTPDFRMWESCRTMLLVDGSSRGSPVSPAPRIPALLHTYLIHPHRPSRSRSSVLTVDGSRRAELYLVHPKEPAEETTSVKKSKLLDEWSASVLTVDGSRRAELYMVHPKEPAEETTSVKKSNREVIHSGRRQNSTTNSHVFAPFSPHSNLIGSQDLVVKRRPNLSAQQSVNGALCCHITSAL
ncbi:hypothetical protein PR048_022713 [Dryococelus australis]|uniref:Uncharacterized protein n=1 Tax=Dryococelus australis TaxID=614101 RepID=A0ABQ9GS59_9NEOP|nr:hypothetical protein PR048_022713 [Dryococelus australis]